MARKDKYNKNVPKVSPITLIIVGLVFIGLILTIALSVKTPKQRLNDFLGGKDHVFELSSFKKVNKKINNGDHVLVLIDVKGSEATKPLFTSLNDALLKKEPYDVNSSSNVYVADDNKVKDFTQVIYYVTIKDAKVMEDFLETHEDIEESFPMVLSFVNKEFKVQHKSPKNLPEDATEEVILFRKNALFFVETTKAFTNTVE